MRPLAYGILEASLTQDRDVKPMYYMNTGAGA